MLANRMSRLGTETAFVVLARAKALEAKGRDIVHLEIGEPDFDTPANIVAKGVEAMQGGETHYGGRSSPTTSPATAASTWDRRTSSSRRAASPSCTS